MLIQVILLYASFAAVDVIDKFLISGRKIRPLAYTFFSLVTGALLLLLWPFVYESLPARSIFLNFLSGTYFIFALYAFFKILSYGEVSRVVPFVFALVPVFDVLISTIVGHSPLFSKELAALALLIPGALLIAYNPKGHNARHIALKILAAFLISSYNYLWVYGAQVGSSLNNLMWNRLFGALMLVLLLAIPQARKNIFSVGNIKKKGHTSFLFLLKQAIGGLAFVWQSHLLTVSKVAIVDGLAGFRYSFVFVFSLFLSKKFKHILQEDNNRYVIIQKIVAIALIFIGTLMLFL